MAGENINAPLEIPDTGAVFTWGRSRFGDNQPSHFFIRNDPVIDISCGDEHTVLVCEKGRVFVFGNNGNGQLGLGHTRAISKPTCIKTLKPWKIELSACGRAHSLFATGSIVFACGANSDGQLGLGDQLDRLSPTQIQIEELSNIVGLAAGSMHSALLTDNNQVWTWGNNLDGQCGINKTDSVVLTPTRVELDNIIALACGYYHTLFASRDYVWAAGEGDGGKLGIMDKKHENLIYPHKMDSLDGKILNVAAGGNHSLVLTDSKVYGFGNNFSGQLGNVEIIQNQITNIACGESHSAFLTENGQLWTCGDTRHGKLGHDDNNLQLVPLPPNLNVSRVQCGGCHTVALASPSIKKLATVDEENTLPPIKLKRNSIIESIIPKENETIVIMDDNEEDDDADDEKDTVSQTESAHKEDLPEKCEEKCVQFKEEVLSPVATSKIRNLLNRFRKAPPKSAQIESKACAIL